MQLREAGTTHGIEKVGADLRGMMPWLKSGKAARDQAAANRG
jgi:ketol-acid reductoisomerase